MNATLQALPGFQADPLRNPASQSLHDRAPARAAFFDDPEYSCPANERNVHSISRVFFLKFSPGPLEIPRKQNKGRDRSRPLRFRLLDSALNPAWWLQRLHVGCLPSLGALYNVELHGLTFLQTLEATRVNRRIVNKYIFAVLARNKPEALRVIEPLHSTLFHWIVFPTFLNCAG